MADERVIPVKSSDDIVTARQAGREVATHLGFSMTEITMITTAISEVARNITSYAGEGELRLSITEHGGRRALVVEALDEGPGIEDVAIAMQDGYSTGSGFGLGLPGARRLMDEFEIRSTRRVGTSVVMRKWAPPCGR